MTDPPVPAALDALLQQALDALKQFDIDKHRRGYWISNRHVDRARQFIEAALRAAGPRHREFAAKLFNIVLGDLEWVRAQGGRHSVCPLCHCVCERDGGPGHADDCPRIEIAQEFNALYPSSPGAAGPGRTPIEGAEAAAVAPVPSEKADE